MSRAERLKHEAPREETSGALSLGLVASGKVSLQTIQRGEAALKNLSHPTTLLAGGGVLLLAAILIINANSPWFRDNGGLAGWLQTIGSLYAIAAISVPVLLERRLATTRARQSLLASAELAYDLMSYVARIAFDRDARFSEWYVPQWQVIDEVLQAAPVHEIDSPGGMRAFVSIRELYGRMRAWDETNEESWPRSAEGGTLSYVGNLVMNAGRHLEDLRGQVAGREQRHV
ncbi:hypothetical protein [Sphingomonas kyeonggiensis]|uniref:Uncharacterized protein n=1 Tax=Sphingomonas kyeonggiensis TaxID=1268553 RepID=A0A7W6NYB4_9SPHN|nr:hypothetical protein [Sphingomonas kyeonggiensis]MBB4101029.1 hypothetical protein [Sphingomonas kyeonggiensis]